MNDPKEYYLNSGGAVGADFFWGELGKEYGIPDENIKHWRPEDYRKLGSVDKEIVDYHVKEACTALDRPFRPWNAYYPLIARDWFQVEYSEAVYAVGRIISPNEKGARDFINTSGKEVVDGGTGYAVGMGIHMGIPVYVFDMNRDHGWYIWDEDAFAPLIIKDIVLPHTPKLTTRFAGIGSRQITDAGIQAIKDVYTKTFKL